MMLTVQNLSKSFGVDIVLSQIGFALNPGERLALVGPNGCGKSTLIRILMGLEKADSGSVRFDPPDVRVGYLPQGFEFEYEETVGGFINRMEGDLEGLSADLEELAMLLGDDPDQPELLDEYDEILAKLQLASETAGRGPGVLAALGLEDVPLETPVAVLSGGQKTRLALAGALLSNPQLLLLDEPTNHLDIAMLEWLEDWLSGFQGAVLLVSHDRAFLDGVATSILEIDRFTHRSKIYAGNYQAYLEQKQGEQDHQWEAYTDQLEEIGRLRSAAAHLRGIAQFRKGGKADSGDKFAKGFFANRGLGTVGRAKQIERRVERLMGDDKIEKPKLVWEMKIEWGGASETGRDVVVCEELAIGYEGKALLSEINLVLRYGQRVALIGPNGSGKSTLMRTIAGQLPAVGGQVRLGSGVRPGYMAQEQEELDGKLNVLDTIRKFTSLNETAEREFLSKFLFKQDDVFTPVGKLSYGERARLSLACLAAQGCNLLLLDEPINHLDLSARSRFEQALKGFEGTILAVVHDRYFIQGFATSIWAVEDDRIVVKQ
jgi:ATP-binding cassette, subfamily F, member 3